MLGAIDRAHRAGADQFGQSVFRAERFLERGGEHVGSELLSVVRTEIMLVGGDGLTGLTELHGVFD